jgi:hypothetical protein
LSDDAKKLYDIDFYNADGEHDGYWAKLTAEEAEAVKVWLVANAFHGDWSDVSVTLVDDSMDRDSLMEALKERLGIDG